MPQAGGQATITGIDFELWVIAWKFTDAFFDYTLKIMPEALPFEDLPTRETKIASIDDIYIQSNSKQEFYNIKYRAPNAGNWTFSSLKREKVLKQFKKQFLKTPNAFLYFVTQSACPIFAEILPRGANCKSREELEIVLKANRYIEEWDKLKKEMSFSDEQMIKFAKQVKFEHVINIEEIKKTIKSRFQGHVSNLERVPGSLYQLAVEAATQSKAIAMDDVKEYLEKNNSQLKAPSKVEELLEKIRSASFSLASVPCTPGTVHIKRKEVPALLNWVKAPLKENDSPIAVITGNAGCGKTVIMRDLLMNLQKENIPVLGIKSDSFIFNSIEALSKELELSDGIKETMVAIVEKYGKGAVLFDQLDALSLTMSKDRKAINMYFNLISKLSLIRELRIILSCRTFDLKYDSVLSSFENKYIVNVGNLDNQQVSGVLSHLGIKKQQISNTLFDLLKTPLHLAIFCRIYKPYISLTSLNTLQDLYNELWNQKILGILDGTLQKDVLDAMDIIIKKMDEEKVLTIPFALLDRNSKGRNYLLSQSILYKQNSKFQFFHSTFFDYCYARTFLTRHDSLIQGVLEQPQSLFVRSQIKQALAFLRGSDFQKYLVELRQFLTNPDVRFHIRLLVINQLGFQQNPTDGEWQIVKQLLEKDSKFKKYFIEAVQSEKWLKYLIESGYLQAFLQSGDEKLVNLIVWKLRSFINRYTKTVIDFLEQLPNVEKKSEHIACILGGLDHWEDERAINLFQNNISTIKNWDKALYKYHFLERILEYDPKCVFNIFFDDLNEKIHKIKSFSDLPNKEFLDHDDIKIFEKLLNWNPNMVLPNALQIISILVDKTKVGTETEFYYDMAFYDYEYYETDIHSRWQFLSLVLQKLETVAANDKGTFIKLVEGFSTSNSLTLLKIVMRGYNSKPDLYVYESFELFKRDRLLENMANVDILRKLLKNSYSYFSEEQKERINKIILSILPEWKKKRKKEELSMIGFSKYKLLCAIPTEELSNYPTMKKQLLELKHKFGKCEEHPLSISGAARSVGPPLPKTAYKKMTLGQWLNSFKKYNGSTEWLITKEGFPKGGIEQHSQAFAEQVSRHPDKFYEFVFNLGERDDISITYFRAGLDGLIKAKYDTDKIKITSKTF
jgi:hypothetical protein